MDKVRKVKLTPEQEEYIRNNYRTSNNKDIASAIGIKHPKIVSFALKFLGLKRTKDEIDALIVKASKAVDWKAVNSKRMKIEGGGRGSGSVRWHLDKWQKENGPLRKGQMLIYENADYGNYNDLILLPRGRAIAILASRGRKVDKAKRKEVVKAEEDLKRKEKREKRRLELEAKAIDIANRKRERAEKKAADEAEKARKKSEREREQMLRRLQKEKEEADKRRQKELKKRKSGITELAKKRKQEELTAQEKFNEFKKNYKPKTVVQAQKELIDQGRVPVKLDAKTTIWVLRSKCIQKEDGTWIKK